MQAGSASNSRASSIGSGAKGTSTPVQNIDIYRPLANQVTVGQFMKVDSKAD